MNVRRIGQKAKILNPEQLTGEIALCEIAARISHRSEGNLDPLAFLRKWSHHETIWEFGHMTVVFKTSRAIANELTRHRMASFIQESTRYVTYEDLDIITSAVDANMAYYEQCHVEYWKQVQRGIAPEIARDVLPLATATTVGCKANFREWRHIFKMRYLNKDAHPDIRWLIGAVWAETPDIIKWGLDDAS